MSRTEAQRLIMRLLENYTRCMSVGNTECAGVHFMRAKRICAEFKVQRAGY